MIDLLKKSAQYKTRGGPGTRVLVVFPDDDALRSHENAVPILLMGPRVNLIHQSMSGGATTDRQDQVWTRWSDSPKSFSSKSLAARSFASAAYTHTAASARTFAIMINYPVRLDFSLKIHKHNFFPTGEKPHYAEPDAPNARNARILC
jgi:hypothetical protein